MALVVLSQHVLIFLLFSSAEDERATLYSFFDLPLSHSLEGLLVRVAPVGTVGSLLSSLYSRVTDSRCLGF